MKSTNRALSFDNSITKLPYSICSLNYLPVASRHWHFALIPWPMVDPWDPQVQTVVQAISQASLEQLQILVSKLIPGNLIPSAAFIQTLSPSARANVFRACLIVFILSENTIVPRQLQLRAALADSTGRLRLNNNIWDWLRENSGNRNFIYPTAWQGFVCHISAKATSDHSSTFHFVIASLSGKLMSDMTWVSGQSLWAMGY
jgi:hypothetical protein